MRLIDADTLLKEWRLECGGACFIRKDKYCMHYDRTKGICTLIIKAPTVEPIKHGRWIQCADVYSDGDYECSECHKREWSDTDYCPNCGATMDLDEVEE